MYQVAQHNSSLSAWVVAHGDVYDSTDFLNKHPAGAANRPLFMFFVSGFPDHISFHSIIAGPKVILRQSGSDQTESFDFHSKKARKMWKESSPSPCPICNFSKLISFAGTKLAF